MSKSLITGITLIAMSCTVSAKSFNKVIYGSDDRRDVFQVTNPMHLELARSTAAMVPSDKISILDNDTTLISSMTLAQKGICESAKFSNQGVASNCSGFLIAEDLLVTAGHCMQSESACSGSKWVFGYANQTSDITANISVDSSNVYGCKEIISAVLDASSKNDYAIIRLDRVVKDRSPLTVRTEGRVKKGQQILVIGHPSGLPTKIATNAGIRGNNNDIFFVTNLDTFGGNSGSAVFNADTGVVEGVLVRGEQDYEYDWSQGCRVPKNCSDTGCRGEDVTRITNIPEIMAMFK